MRTFIAVLLLALAGCASAGPSAEKYTYRVGMQDGGLCSATAVAANVLLTAKHCLQPSDNFVVLEDRRIPILRVEVDSRDHALVWVGKKFPAWAKRGPAPPKGAALSFFGNVDGFVQLYRTGRMAGWEGGAMVYDMTCGKGDSGAGVFNESGELVGMVSAVYVGPIVRLCISYPWAFSPQQLARL